MHKTFCIALLGITSFFSTLVGHEFFYFTPQQISKHLANYSEEEKEAIAQDLDVVRSVCLPNVSRRRETPIYIATAGSPGSRKSTILERFLAQNERFSQAAYIDPDQRGLKFMVHTYYAQSLSARAISNYQDYSQATKAAYEKWRSASNYITLVLMEEAFWSKRDIVYGTTSTGVHTEEFLAKVKDRGYEIVLLLCSCEEAFREQALNYRIDEQRFYQSTPEDALSKGKLFPQRMAAYFTHADTLYLYWSDELFVPERLAAVCADGRIQIMDSGAFELFLGKFESDRTLLQTEGHDIPSWNELVALYCNRFEG